MPLTNAERQRRFREKRDRDPVLREEHLAKRKEKYKADIECGKRRLIKDLTPREQRHKRKSWKRSKRNERFCKKKIEESLAASCTPPASPGPSRQNNHPSTLRKNRNKAKCYRDNEKLRQEIVFQRRLAQKYRMRLNRRTELRKDPDTPRSKTNRLLRNWSTEKGKGTRISRRKLKMAAKRTLVFQFALSEELKSKYRQINLGQRKSLLQIAKGNIMKKYKLIKKVMDEFKMFGGRENSKKGSVTSRIKDKVHAFYERDDISRITSGIKETVTRNGEKRQKRILTDRIDKIHERFLVENTAEKISYSTFSRLRPFWVLPPKEADRRTCACKSHENMQFITNALFKSNIVKTDSLTEIVKSVACDTSNKDCMYGKCDRCKDVNLPIEKKFDRNVETTWFQWQTKKETRDVRGEKKDVTFTVKECVSDSLGSLIEKFKTEMQRFKIHVFNVKNQLNHYRFLKENLKPNEALIHVDFAENFVGKHSTEIQSMHFGASKTQITLHTGVCYSSQGTQTFCTASDSLDHSPSGIWAYLHPVLDDILKENDQIDHIHFYSDGPCAQYRQKGNFYLFSKEMADRKIEATWNFHESGHGKGVPDGVGGSLKRSANELVLQGYDITNTESFVKALRQNETKVKVYEVSQKDVDEKAQALTNKTLKTIPGTFKIHQIKTSTVGKVFHRPLSCSCDGEHKGHHWNVGDMEIQEKSRTQEKKGGKRTEESESTERCSGNENVTPNCSRDDLRQEFFLKSLKNLEKCQSFSELESSCRRVFVEMAQHNYDCIDPFQPTMSNTGASVDKSSLRIFPKDIPATNKDIYPIKVKGDGNCLPSTGSILAFGSDRKAVEMRVRIIVEATLNKSLYLDHEYLSVGSNWGKDLTKSYAMYSDEYTPGHKLDAQKIEEIYEKETLKIKTDKTYMGIWQLFALASVLQSPIQSVYPNLGNPFVRKDLHRIIYPREEKQTCTRHVMWTTTRMDMRPRHWVPNHFVAVLPSCPDEYAENQSDSTRTPGFDMNTELTPESLLGSYVLVRYDNEPYPGVVVECDDSDIYVRCMHRVGKKNDTCSFFWPRSVIDECWYSAENVLCVIPEPKREGQHYYIDSEKWAEALQKCLSINAN